MDLKTFKINFDIEFKNYISHKINNAQNLVNHKKIINFLEYLQKYIFSGWKRIRPYVFYITYLAFSQNQNNENEQNALHFSMIFEILHTMALVHDDIIDKSEKRHNVQTIHTRINQQINNPHIANSQAILIWDLLLSRVYEFLHKEQNFNQKLMNKAKINIHEMIEEVILGQMIDVDMMLWEPANETTIQTKNLYKTAKYTFTKPMTTGAILANTKKTQIQNISNLWTELGLAFQTKDDLQDLTNWDPSKTQFLDVQEGQQTIFTNYIFTQGNQTQKTTLQNSLWKTLPNEQIKKLQELFQDSGAIQYGKNLIQFHLNNAKKILKTTNFPNPQYKKIFLLLIQKLSN